MSDLLSNVEAEARLYDFQDSGESPKCFSAAHGDFGARLTCSA